ncbi:hypothetical protein [Nocardiopsis potens]|uniref:hypothetical protein n=1 Tax=Nocardiopsis potens TaxID=1246458 RepID=UPI000349E421|nr:hypothetical protein [Nocardiopsis potens]
MPPWLIVAAVLAAVAVVGLVCGGRASERAVRRFARSARLSGGADAELADRLGRRTRAAWTGASAVLAAAIAIGLLFPRTYHASGWGLALVAALTAGWALGPAAAVIGRALRGAPKGPRRVARAVVPTVADHVGPAERLAALAAALSPAAVTAGAAAAAALGAPGRELLPWWLSVLLSAIGLGCFAAAEGAAARLVAAPRPAETEQALRREDALRAQALRGLYRASAIVPLCIALLLVLIADPWVGEAASAVSGHAAYTAAALLLALSAAAFAGAAAAALPGRRFADRLWRSAPGRGAA